MPDGERDGDEECENKANTDTCLHSQAYIEHEHVMLSHIAVSVQMYARYLFCYTCLKPIWIANFGLINSFRLNPQYMYILWSVEGGDSSSRGGCFKTFSHVFSSFYSIAFLFVSLSFFRSFSHFFFTLLSRRGCCFSHRAFIRTLNIVCNVDIVWCCVENFYCQRIVSFSNKARRLTEKWNTSNEQAVRKTNEQTQNHKFNGYSHIAIWHAIFRKKGIGWPCRLKVREVWMRVCVCVCGTERGKQE